MDLKKKYLEKLNIIINAIYNHSNKLIQAFNIDYLDNNTNKLIEYWSFVESKLKNLTNINYFWMDKIIENLNYLVKKYLIKINMKNKVDIYLRKYLIFIVKCKIYTYFLLNSLENKNNEINSMDYPRNDNVEYSIIIKDFKKFKICKKYKELKKIMMINLISGYYMFNKNFNNFKNLFSIEYQRSNNFLNIFSHDSLKNIKIETINLVSYSYKVSKNFLKLKSYKDIKEEFDLINCFACPLTYFSFAEIPNYFLFRKTFSLINYFLKKHIRLFINVKKIEDNYFEKNNSKFINNGILYLKSINYEFTIDEYKNFTQLNFEKDNKNIKKVRIVSNIDKNYNGQPITVIYHIHGGGFVCLSSSQYKILFRYLIKNIKNCMIFTLDYTLSPKETYPCSFNDVIIGYIWMLNYIKIVLKLNSYNINLMGDSAGGSLSTMLMNWIIENKLNIPKTIILSYPVINFNTNNYSTSHKYIFKDVALNYGFLSICLKSYLPESPDFENDYYWNLLNTPKEIIEKYPKTMLNICDKDILKDNSIRFYYFLKNNNVDINCVLYKDTFHGIVNIAFYFKLRFLMEVNKDIVNFIKNNN